MKQLDHAMKVLSALSTDARAAGYDNLFYAANRAWHELYEARARAQPEKR